MRDPCMIYVSKALQPSGHDHDNTAKAFWPSGLDVGYTIKTCESNGTRIQLLPLVDAQWNKVPYILNTYLEGSGVTSRIHIS